MTYEPVGLGLFAHVTIVVPAPANAGEPVDPAAIFANVAFMQQGLEGSWLTVGAAVVRRGQAPHVWAARACDAPYIVAFCESDVEPRLPNVEDSE